MIPHTTVNTCACIWKQNSGLFRIAWQTSVSQGSGSPFSNASMHSMVLVFPASGFSCLYVGSLVKSVILFHLSLTEKLPFLYDINLGFWACGR